MHPLKQTGKISLSRRNFLKISLAGGVSVAISPLNKLLSATPTRRGADMAQLFAGRRLVWVTEKPSVFSGGSAYDPQDVMTVTDNAQITVAPDPAHMDVRRLTDPMVTSSVSVGLMTAYVHSLPYNTLDWQLVAFSDNIAGLNPAIGDNILVTRTPHLLPWAAKSTPCCTVGLTRRAT